MDQNIAPLSLIAAVICARDNAENVSLLGRRTWHRITSLHCGAAASIHGQARLFARTSLLRWPAGEVTKSQNNQFSGRGLTLRSSGPPTACHQARTGGTRYIFTSPGLASRRRGPLSSNVRRQPNTNRGARLSLFWRLLARAVWLRLPFLFAPQKPTPSSVWRLVCRQSGGLIRASSS